MIQTPVKPLFSTGSVIDGKWILMERIGKGGMGEVYRAHQLNLKRDVAIKIISRELMDAFKEDPAEAQRAFKRLQREVQTMAQVRHHNALQIFDFGEIEAPGNEGRPMQYIVMEYVPGNTLRFTMSEEGFGDEADLLRDWLRQCFFPVLDGMEAVHAKGIVHRDMKPENVLMDGDSPKIADFGLARSVSMRAISNSWDVKGTMHYMAPEQFIDFRKVGPTADVYALGKIIYEAVEGKIGQGLVPLKSVDLGNPDDPFLQEIDSIIRKATAESPAERFQTIAAFRSALKGAMAISERRDTEFTAASGWRRGHRWILAFAGLALASVLAMAAWHLWSGNPGSVQSPPTESFRASGLEDPPAEIRGTDGKQMVLIEAKPSEPSSARAFYMDREKVTYYDYVEFLDEVKDRLTVDEGAVAGPSGDIWLYMGTGSEPYEQIFHEHNRFHLRDPAYADRPVVRVSFFGARAYARHYGKQLPTESQWNRAASWISPKLPANMETVAGSGGEADSGTPSGHMHMMDAAGGQSRAAGSNDPPAMELPLADPAMHVREWAVNGGAENQALVVSWDSLSGGSQPTVRYRSEGFPDVGFRTVISLRRTGT